MRSVSLLAVGFGIFALIFIGTIFLSQSMKREPENLVALQQSLSLATQFVGLVVTVFAVLVLLNRSTPADSLAAALGVLAGILLLDRHWYTMLAFLGVAIMLWVNARFAPPPNERNV
jgi:uncharacterized membrane protein YkgB